MSKNFFRLLILVAFVRCGAYAMEPSYHMDQKPVSVIRSGSSTDDIHNFCVAFIKELKITLESGPNNFRKNIEKNTKINNLVSKCEIESLNPSDSFVKQCDSFVSYDSPEKTSIKVKGEKQHIQKCLLEIVKNAIDDAEKFLAYTLCSWVDCIKLGIFEKEQEESVFFTIKYYIIENIWDKLTAEKKSIDSNYDEIVVKNNSVPIEILGLSMDLEELFKKLEKQIAFLINLSEAKVHVKDVLISLAFEKEREVIEKEIEILLSDIPFLNAIKQCFANKVHEIENSIDTLEEIWNVNKQPKKYDPQEKPFNPQD